MIVSLDVVVLGLRTATATATAVASTATASTATTAAAASFVATATAAATAVAVFAASIQINIINIIDIVKNDHQLYLTRWFITYNGDDLPTVIVPPTSGGTIRTLCHSIQHRQSLLSYVIG